MRCAVVFAGLGLLLALLLACRRGYYSPNARRHQEADALYAAVTCDRTEPHGCHRAAAIACFGRGYDVLDKETPARGMLFWEIRCHEPTAVVQGWTPPSPPAPSLASSPYDAGP